MSIINNEMLWRQFAVSIDTFGDALRDCPDELWEGRLWEDQPDQWVAAGFLRVLVSGLPHALLAGPLPDGRGRGLSLRLRPLIWWRWKQAKSCRTPIRRAELLGYLEHCRRRCQETIGGLSSEDANRLCQFPWGELPFGELLLYTMRHVQEHAAQLHLFLGQQAGKSTT